MNKCMKTYNGVAEQIKHPRWSALQKQSKRFILDVLSVPVISIHAKDIDVYKYQKNKNQLKNVNVYQILVCIQIHSPNTVQSLLQFANIVQSYTFRNVKPIWYQCFFKVYLQYCSLFNGSVGSVLSIRIIETSSTNCVWSSSIQWSLTDSTFACL